MESRPDRRLLTSLENDVVERQKHAPKEQEPPRTVRTKTGSLNPFRYSWTTNGLGLCGRRDLTVRHVTIKRTRKRKATARIVQGNPTLSTILVTMTGRDNAGDG